MFLRWLRRWYGPRLVGRPQTDTHSQRGIMVIRQSAVIALAVLTACETGSRDPAGSYAFVQVSAAAETVLAGRNGAFGNLQLVPGGRLVGEASLTGLAIPLSGTWYREGDSVHLVLEKEGAVRTSWRGDGTLRFAYPMLELLPGRVWETVMKSELRNLMSAQESYFADMARYTRSLSELNFKPSTGVSGPHITLSGHTSYTATVTHSNAPGAMCGFVVGTMPHPVSGASRHDIACQIPASKDTAFLDFVFRRVE